MEYTTLTASDQADLLRRRVLQAEADHFIHTTDCDEKRAVLAVIPAGKAYDGDRAVVQSVIDQLTNLAAAAEERKTIACEKLEAMGEPVVKPDDTVTEPVPVELRRLADTIRADDGAAAEEISAIADRLDASTEAAVVVDGEVAG